MFFFGRYRKIDNVCRHITNSYRKFNEAPKHAFIIDNSYDLVKKLKQQNNSIPQVDPIHGFPSSFARNLLHPFSNHIVSKYASEYYKKAKPYYLGEYPMQFFASEMSYITPETSCPIPNTPSNTHSIVLFPHQIKIKEIEIEHIPYIISLCNNDNAIQHLVHSKDPRIEKIEGITLYFYCDVATIDTTLTLFQWFDYCFRLSNFSKVNYIFSSGNLKNDQSSTILIHNEKTQIILSQHLVLREVDYIVQHMISTYF